ncbi:TIGR02921 family PEP-CTERM protein, partial [Dolichospermum sp. ST_sed3]|nr:TIGR02921 family PEP-CTERM protein [Dolichospermum sp. ST_sed3]
ILPNFSRDSKKYFHLYLSYKCINENQNLSPLPKLLEKRNVYWSSKTKLTINGENIKKSRKSTWFPNNFKVDNEMNEITEFNALIDNVNVKAKKFDQLTVDISGNYAILIDNSYSMNSKKEYISKSIDYLKSLKNFTYDIYIQENQAFDVKKNNEFKLDDLIYFGNIDIYKLLSNFQENNPAIKYDGLIVLTDKGSYEISKDQKKSLTFDFPIHLVHLNNDLPSSYEDKLYETIQKSNGYIKGSIEDLMKYLSFIKNNNENVRFDGQYIWEFNEINQNEEVKFNTTKEFENIAVKQYINYLVKKIDMNNIENIDKIHNLCKTYSIVSQYSSMIVLVDDRQKKLLKEAESKSDRFDREVETGKENMTKPFNPFKSSVNGVPEPEQWLLIIVVLIFIIFNEFKKRRLL